ncbi:titin-like [Paramacrobiotus metropolitanus]|uniref:titin-like n=1 Tax=Paramacrobiotus metropolitanus TaxID=2943436 RepID=UPI002445DFBF|nr:titin-like [Paramacrobiotus metropolitanus]
MNTTIFSSVSQYLLLICILQLSFLINEYGAVKCPSAHTFRLGHNPTTTIVCAGQSSYSYLANVTWKFTRFSTANFPEDEIIISPSHRYQVQIDGDSTMLTIRNPAWADVGHYRIVLNETDEAVVELQALPWIFIHPANGIHFYAGTDHVEIECLQAAPLPNVTFSWLRDGEIMNEFSHPQIGFSSNAQNNTNAKLIFGTVDYLDRALYTCVVSGQYGNDTANLLLRVRSPRCWLYPFTGCFGLLFILAVILGIDEWRKKRSRNREQDDLKEVFAGGNQVREGDVKNFPEIVAVNVPPKGEPSFISYKALQDREIHD